MKKLFLSIFLTACFVLNSFSGNYKSCVSGSFSYNKIEFSYNYKLPFYSFWSEVYCGLGNQDINSSFDDFLAGLRVGCPVFSVGRSNFDVYLNIGGYFPHNNYYDADSFVSGAGARYSLFLGSNRRNCLFVDAGYQYGKRSYKQEYVTPDVYIAATGTFRVPPVFFSIGYGYRF